ncbi:MAG TPA: hypothetical protein GXZ90_07090 [Clostridiales bacterium]|nr:hypothetical protein [Clostridiales bacterium]
MARKNNVVKFKKRKNINIGIVIFFIMFIYIIIQIYFYYTKEHLTIYEVKEGSNVEETKVTGLIWREEEIFYTNEAGYLSYLIKEGERAYKNSPIYSIDDNKEIYDLVTSGEILITNPPDSINLVKSNINRFHTKYSDVEYKTVYDFKEKMTNVASSLLNEAMLLNIDKIKDSTGYSSNFHTVYTEKSGIISYYIDSFESIPLDQISMDMFDLDNYNKTNIRTNEMLPSNTPAYKLISNDNWSILIPLNEKQYSLIEDKEYIEFTCLKNKLNFVEKFTIVKNNNDNFAKIDLNKYLPLYIDDRYLDLQINLNKSQGMKIPLTAITEKEFYIIPLSFFTTGGNSVEPGLIKEIFDKDTGEITYEFVEANIYYDDGKYAYIDTKVFNLDSSFYSQKDNSSFKINKTGRLTGVFNVNKGYAVFCRIEPLYQNDSYCIIDMNTKNGLSLYDHIALDASIIEESRIIY